MQIIQNETIAISKPKALFGIALGLLMLALGIWLLLSITNADATPITAKTAFIWVICVVTVLFSLLTIGIAAKNLLCNQAGLSFNTQGIIYHARNNQLIAWQDIRGFDVYKTHQQKLLVILLRQPERYVQQGSFWQRRLYAFNMAACGSPITIASHSFAVTFDTLVETCVKHFTKYGQINEPTIKLTLQSFIKKHYPYWIL
jgi:hypothetical protein